MRLLLTTILFGLSCLCALPSAMAAQMLVIIEATNSGEALKLGAVLSADAQVSLAAGARLSLLTEKGRLVVLTGPYDGKADTQGLIGGAPDAPSVLAKLSSLIVGQASTIATGASRGVGTQDGGEARPHLSYISVMSSGERCALSKWPELWRADDSQNQSLTLTNGQGRNSALTWPAGDDRIDLPAAFVADGAKITALLAGRSVDLRLHVRPGTVGNPTETFAWMVDKGCTDQAVALLGALRKKAARK